MEKLLENLWVLFIGIGSWCLNRITAKIDTLEAEKADAKQTREEHLSQSTLIHELDRRVDENQHTSIGRIEDKSDVKDLHARINDLEQRKAPRNKEKNGG